MLIETRFACKNYRAFIPEYRHHAKTFTLTSNDLGGQFTQKQFTNGMGYQGDNLSPHLAWQNAPEDTKSFAITMYDVYAPTGSGFWHWVCLTFLQPRASYRKVPRPKKPKWADADWLRRTTRREIQRHGWHYVRLLDPSPQLEHLLD